jgi:hypothetical protein
VCTGVHKARNSAESWKTEDRIIEDSGKLCQVGIEQVHRCTEEGTLLRVQKRQNH